jgi:hypothetical protein
MAWEPYTEQQWQELTDAAPAIARGVAWISGPGAESEGELDAFVKFVEEAYRTVPDTGVTLLGKLVTDIHGRLAGGMSLPEGDAMIDGLQAARKAAALLELYPDTGQAREVRQWLFEAGRHVAEAKREGGVFGIGAQQVSSPEADTLVALADALGVSESAEA